jgi:hypothetical protein
MLHSQTDILKPDTLLVYAAWVIEVVVFYIAGTKWFYNGDMIARIACEKLKSCLLCNENAVDLH